MVLIFVLARKDTPEMDSHVNAIKSSLQYLKQAALHINDCPWKLASFWRPVVTHHSHISITILFVYHLCF